MTTDKKTDGSETMLKQKTGNEDAYFVKLPVFEGPFELLFYLVKKEEINIWDISLARITEEYLNYMRAMQKLKIDLAGDFLVMAATLLSLKSKMLLPKPPPEITQKEEEAFFFGSKEELVNRLLEYNYFKTVSLKLKERENEHKKIFLRSQGAPKVLTFHKQSSLYPHSFALLKKTYLNLRKKERIKKEEKETFTSFEEITILKKIDVILETIKKTAGKSFFMEKLLSLGEKKDIVATFIALLELTRRGKIYLSQKTLFAKIKILGTARESGIGSQGLK